MRSREDPGDRGDDDRHPRPRQRPETGLERAVALDDLEELGEQEDRAEHPEVHQQRDRVGGAERTAAEEAHRQHRVRLARLPDHEPDEQRGPGHECRDDLGAAPAEVVAVDDAPHEGQQAGADQAEAGDVEAALRAVGLGQAEGGHRQDDEPDRDVEPEDPVPVEALRDGATDERTDGDGQTGDATPRTERDGPALRGHRRGQDRQRQRRDDRAADALDGAREDEAVGRRRQRGQGRAADEDAHADQEHALATEPVAQRGAGDEQDRERQRVRVDDPLEVGQRCAEVGLDDRQGGRHDEVVEGDHEQGERGDGERPERRWTGSGHGWAPPVVVT